ncbi:hypothetical protein RRF57_002205 [Xylaria bambusicola]|uniref:Uncharacterized protein n=1 Tax=Xylaria bambusicola TaxID=326684 RepID=A0AAN7U603_9PEZI
MVESTRRHIKDHDQFPDEGLEEMLLYALNWAYMSCPGVFDFRVAQYRDPSSGEERWGVFFEFETWPPHDQCNGCYECKAWEEENYKFWASVQYIENIAAQQGLEMRYYGMTPEWKELIAKHVRDIVIECYRDSDVEYPDDEVHFFEGVDVDGDLPNSVLLPYALVN